MKVYSNSVVHHHDVPEVDAGRLRELAAAQEQLVAAATSREHEGANRCFVVCVIQGQERKASAVLQEMLGLVDAQGDSVVGHVVREVRQVTAKTLLTRGVLEEIAEQARGVQANLLVFDAQLSPSQARNVEDVCGLAVSDRECVILNVFAKNAQTRRAKLQVELAQLQYLRPRIRGVGLNMDQQVGGLRGGRGPGETASELLARKLDDRLSQLRAALKHVDTSAQQTRKARQSSVSVALVGYTNAGKTSLMNALAKTELGVRDRPFETLDTTSRALARSGPDVVLTDTVGFIRRLPEHLFDSFASTLAAVRDAKLIVHVVDASDPEFPMHVATTRQVLEKLGAGMIPELLVFNKIDQLRVDVSVAQLSLQLLSKLSVSEQGGSCVCSVLQPDSVENLRETILNLAYDRLPRAWLSISYDNGPALALLYSRCLVEQSYATERQLRVCVRASPEVLARLQATQRRNA